MNPDSEQVADLIAAIWKIETFPIMNKPFVCLLSAYRYEKERAEAFNKQALHFETLYLMERDKEEAAEARIEELEKALANIINELGVPSAEYPAPVANAYNIAKITVAGNKK